MHISPDCPPDCPPHYSPTDLVPPSTHPRLRCTYTLQELCRLPVLAGARVIFYISAESYHDDRPLPAPREPAWTSERLEAELAVYRAQTQARAVENRVWLVRTQAPALRQLHVAAFAIRPATLGLTHHTHMRTRTHAHARTHTHIHTYAHTYTRIHARTLPQRSKATFAVSRRIPREARMG